MIPKYNLDNLTDYKIIDYLPVLEPNELDYVYRPNDDSYFLLDALRMDMGEVMKTSDPKWILEIGCGSGMIINNYSYWLQEIGNEKNIFLATDINFDACYLTKKFSDYYNNGIEVFNDDIVSSIISRIEDKIDIIICNPPYVPTSKDELISAKKKLAEKNKNLLIEAKTKMNKINCIDASFAGGIDGMQITNKILSYSEKLLKKGGSFYLLLIEENNPELIINLMENKFFCEVLLKKTFMNEKQYILKFQKK